MLPRGLPRGFREHFDSHGFHAVQFNREFAQCLQLAKNTDKEVFYKIRSKAKDTICAISLIGERCTFNIEQHSDLRQNWNLFWSMTSTSKPAHPGYVDLAAARSKPLKKKFHVVMEQVQELRGKFLSACRKNYTHTVKRMSKASPSPKAHKKSRQGGLFVSTSKDNCEEDLAESFQLLPDDDSMLRVISTNIDSTFG